MRVLAGALKGQRIDTPRGTTTRPTSDRVRIACLDTLMPYLPLGPLLDVFAGAGAVGIEGLSRGAPAATFVERDSRALAALRANIERLGLTDRGRALRGDAPRVLADLLRRGERFAVIFLDPPYAAADVEAAVEAAAGLLAPGGVLALQHATRTALAPTPASLSPWKARRFGETTLTFFRAAR